MRFSEEGGSEQPGRLQDQDLAAAAATARLGAWRFDADHQRLTGTDAAQARPWMEANDRKLLDLVEAMDADAIV